VAASQGGKSKSSTPAQKDRRARSWEGGKKRKVALADAQRKAAEHNRELRRSGQLTPWEQACADRRARRAASRTGKQS